MASGHGNREGILEWEYPWKRMALEPISTARIGAWQNELSSQETYLLERLGSAALTRLGYSLQAKGGRLSPLCLPRIFLKAIRFFFRVPLDDAANQLCGRPFCFH